MKSALLLAALALGALAQDLTINTPTVAGVAGAAECQPVLLSWGGGTPPYIVDVDTSPAGTTHLADFQGLTNTSLTWTVNAAVGTQLLLSIKDNTGLGKTSAPFPVTVGSGDGCLNGGSSPASSGGSPPASSAPGSSPASSSPGSSPASSSPGGSTPSGTSPSSVKQSGSASSSGSGAKTSNTTGAGVAVQAPAGVVPAFAAVLLAGLVALLA